MTFQTIDVDVIGQTYQSRSKPISSQTNINLYPEVNVQSEGTKAYQNWPGAKPFSTGTGVDRGMHTFKGLLYKVSGDKLFSVDRLGNQSTIGTVVGTNRCIFADNGSTLAIATGGVTYALFRGALSTVAGLESPGSVAMLNNQFIFDGDGQRWQSSNPLDSSNGLDGSDISAVNFAEAESNGDDIVRVYVFRQILYQFGTATIEPWYNSGTGSPPFDRVDGGIITKGLHALHSVANSDQFMYFLGDDKNVYQVSTYQPTKITNGAISHQFERLEGSDAIGTMVTLDGQDMYVLTFPTDNVTYYYSEQLGTWGQLAFGTTGDRHLINSTVYLYNKSLIADYRNGNVYELDPDTFTDNGDVQIRQRDTPPITSANLGLPAGQKIMMSSFELIMDAGQGLETGQGSTPTMEFSVSIDGGRNFTGHRSVDIGVGGDYTTKVRYDKLITGDSLVIRFYVSDAVYISISSATIDLQLAGY